MLPSHQVVNLIFSYGIVSCRCLCCPIARRGVRRLLLALEWRGHRILRLLVHIYVGWFRLECFLRNLIVRWDHKMSWLFRPVCPRSHSDSAILILQCWWQGAWIHVQNNAFVSLTWLYLLNAWACDPLISRGRIYFFLTSLRSTFGIPRP